MKFRKAKPCPYPETCPVQTLNTICKGDCADKILVEYYILKQKYDKLQIQNRRMFDKILDLADALSKDKKEDNNVE